MRSAFALALAAGFVVATAGAQEPVTIKWSLKQGETFYAKAVADMDMSMGLLGMNVDLKMKQTTVQRFKVVSVKDGLTTVEMTILDMSMDAAGLPGGGGLPGIGAIGDKVKGAKLTAELDDKMEVKKLIGYEKFLDKIAGDDDNLRAMLGSQLSEPAVSQMVAQAFASVPAMPVKAGDTWSRTTTTPAAGLGDAKVKEKYTSRACPRGWPRSPWSVTSSSRRVRGSSPGCPRG